MANVIKHKRGSGSDPVASDLVVGEVAIRTDVGKLFTKMDNGSVAEIAGGGSDIAINTLSSSSGTGGGSATFNGSAYRFTLSQPPSVSAQQLLVSINGVIQKPVAGTGQPSEGFSVDGTDIILGDAPATGSDFFILTFKSLGVSEPADNSVTSAKIVDGAIVTADLADSAVSTVKIANGAVSNAKIVDNAINNAKVVSDAAIAGTKISPDFGSQNITGTGDLTIDTNTLHVDSSNNRVGIGIASPSSGKLHIEHGNEFGIYTLGAYNFQAKFESTDAEAAIVIEDNGSTNDGNRIGVISDVMAFTTAGTERMRIDSSGNVGIGTTSPETLLHAKVNTFNDDINKVALTLSNNQSSGVHQYFQNTSTGTGVSNGARIGLGNTDNFLIQHFEAKDIQISTNSTERMRIDSSGNVMMGTTTASGAFTIVSTKNAESGRSDASNYHLHLRNNENDNGEAIGISFGITSSSTGVGASILHERDSSGSQGSLQFYTNGDGSSVTERMRIDSAGRVQIGVTSANDTSTALTIKNMHSGSDHTQLEIICDDNETSRITFSEASTINNGSIRYNFVTDTRAMTFHTDGNTERMRIDSSGRVLIGTTDEGESGADELTIATSGDTGMTIRSGSSGVGNIFFSDGTSGADQTRGIVRYFHTTNAMVFNTDNAERMRINSSGNLILSTGTLIIKNAASDSSGLKISQESSDESRIFNHFSGPLTFGTGNTERMRIDSSGSLQIGTLNPDSGGSAIGNDFGFVYLPSGHAIVRSGSTSVSGASGICYTSKFVDTGTGKAFRVMLAQTEIGSIGMGAGGTSFNTSSDYRRKENIVDLTNAITRLKTLLPKRFNFKDDPSVTRDGFLAHEVTAVPEAVTGTKDAVEPEDNEDSGVKKGDPIYQQLDQSKLVPLLVAALQEAIGRIEVLEAK